jgi:hypothetical protein
MTPRRDAEQLRAWANVRQPGISSNSLRIRRRCFASRHIATFDKRRYGQAGNSRTSVISRNSRRASSAFSFAMEFT